MANEKRLIDAMQTGIKLSGRITPSIEMGENPTQVYNEVLQVIAESPLWMPLKWCGVRIARWNTDAG